MHLLLKDRRFKVARASISGCISDPYWCDKFNRGKDKELFWAINVEAQDRSYDGEMWGPAVYHEALRFPARNWHALEGQTLSWDAPYDEVTGERNGGFYVFEHEAIKQSLLRIQKRDGVKFQIAWSGLCDIFWDDDFSENVPFEIDAVATFQGVIVRGSENDTDESLRSRLSQYLDLAGFQQGPVERNKHKYDSGVGMCSCHFVPLQ